MVGFASPSADKPIDGEQPRITSTFGFFIALRLAAVAVILPSLVRDPSYAVAEDHHICRLHLGETIPASGIDLPADDRRYAPDRQVDIEHIRLDVTPDFARRTIGGTTHLELRALARPVAVLQLDAMNLTISAVRSTHAVRDFSNTGRHLQIFFDKPLPAGEAAQIDIDHQAQPTKGFYFRTSEMGYPSGDTHAWTQGESHEARWWFPCFDYPNERSTTEIICHVPADMTVLSNGQMLDEAPEPNSRKRVHWRQDKPHVNYLICLVVGHFAKLEKKHRDIPLGFYTQPSVADHAANSFLDTANIMEFFETEIGVPYPWHKYDQVTIQDFVAGGMENTTMTTLTDGTIFSAASENLKSTRSLDAHELAHQWFGDYVTCKDWSHLWLNEGFATYYQMLYEGHKFGHEALQYELFEAAEGSVLPNGNDPRPIVHKAYGNADEQFDWRAYNKGSWVLHMLRSQLGPDQYRACIRQYLQQYALQNVVTEDLREVVEKQTGKSFDRFFDQWVYHPGHPEITVRYEWLADRNLAYLKIQQSIKNEHAVKRFHIPTQIAFVVDGRTIESPIEITELEQEFFVSLPSQPTTVRFDPHYTVLAEVRFDRPISMLLTDLLQKDDTVGRVLAARSLGDHPTHESVDALRRVLREDPFFGVRMHAARALEKHQTDDAYAALCEQIDQPDARVRQQVIRSLTRYYRPSTLTIVLSLLEKELNPTIRADLVRELGRYQDPRARQWIIESLNSNSFRNELADAAVAAAGLSRSPELRNPLRKAIELHASRFTSRGLARSLVTLAELSREPGQQRPVRELILAYMNDPRRPVRIGAIQALGELRDPTGIGPLDAIPTRPNDPVSAAAREARARIQETAPAAPQEVVELRKQLSDLKETQESLKRQLDSLRDELNRATPAKSP